MTESDWKRVVVILMRRMGTRSIKISDHELAQLDPRSRLEVFRSERPAMIEIMFRPGEVQIEGEATVIDGESALLSETRMLP